MSREVKDCPWDIENVQVPKGVNPEDVVEAIRYFVKSLGFKSEFKITIFTASVFHKKRGIPFTVYSRLQAMEQVKIVSWAKSKEQTFFPTQIADRLMKNHVMNICRTSSSGLVVIIGGDKGYRSLFHHIKKNTELKIIWIYPSDIRTNYVLRAIAMRISIAAICFEDLIKNFKTYQRAIRSPPRSPPRRVRSPLRRSPIRRRSRSPIRSRRLPDSPPRRRPGSPIRRRGETPPRRRPASPSRGRSPSSPSPRRFRSPPRARSPAGKRGRSSSYSSSPSPRRFRSPRARSPAGKRGRSSSYSSSPSPRRINRKISRSLSSRKISKREVRKERVRKEKRQRR